MLRDLMRAALMLALVIAVFYALDKAGMFVEQPIENGLIVGGAIGVLIALASGRDE